MRITIVANSSRGDVQPYVALGLGLQASGHQVRVAAPTTFRAFVEERGLRFADLQADPQAIVRSDVGQAWLESGRNPFAFVLRLEPILEPVLDRFLTASRHACEDAEAIVYSPFGVVGYHIAEAMGIPAILASPVPVVRTSAFPSPIVPIPPVPLGPLTPVYNQLSHWLVEQLFWQPFRRRSNRWRVEELGLTPLPFAGPFGRITREREIVLHAYSRYVVPRPRDWPDWARVSGYWFLDRPATWSPPAGLTDFLTAGPPPVYVGLGSMAGRDPEHLTTLVLDALRRSGQRGVLLSGWAGLGGSSLSDDVFVVDDVPHDWLFERVAAVVHHGGAGTTGAGLRAGRPTVILPFFADQPFWGWRVNRLGVGPRPIPQPALTAEKLASAIVTATSNLRTIDRAAHLGAAIRSEDGVAAAVAIIGERLANPKRTPGPRTAHR